jgi:co-chaperonin GroES (HSP10)
VGDIVILASTNGTTVQIDGDTFLVISETAIAAILT